jgi:hypothetical protein
MSRSLPSWAWQCRSCVTISSSTTLAQRIGREAWLAVQGPVSACFCAALEPDRRTLFVLGVLENVPAGEIHLREAERGFRS